MKVKIDINRITVEFKVAKMNLKFRDFLTILIESQWNLKQHRNIFEYRLCFILIESQWNLKHRENRRYLLMRFILIESQWNLKRICTLEKLAAGLILIESQWNLKIASDKEIGIFLSYINRITVEFKGLQYSNLAPYV